MRAAAPRSPMRIAIIPILCSPGHPGESRHAGVAQRFQVQLGGFVLTFVDGQSPETSHSHARQAHPSCQSVGGAASANKSAPPRSRPRGERAPSHGTQARTMLKRASRVPSGRMTTARATFSREEIPSKLATNPNGRGRKPPAARSPRLPRSSANPHEQQPSVCHSLLPMYSCRVLERALFARGESPSASKRPLFGHQRTALAPRHRTRERASPMCASRGPAAGVSQERARRSRSAHRTPTRAPPVTDWRRYHHPAQHRCHPSAPRGRVSLPVSPRRLSLASSSVWSQLSSAVDGNIGMRRFSDSAR